VSVHDLCWDDLKLFSAVAQDKTLGAAAETLGISQPTAGRRLATLQKKMGVPLVQRAGRGYLLTEDGRNVLKYVDEMSKQAQILEQSYGCGPKAVSGTVRVFAPEWFISHVILEKIFSSFDERMLVEMDLSSDPSLGELDSCQTTLLIRHEPFEETHVVHRNLVSVRYAVYASKSLLNEAMRQNLDLQFLPVIGMTFEHSSPTCFGLLRDYLPDNPVHLRVDTINLQIEACQKGLGLCILPQVVGVNAQLTKVENLVIPDQTLWMGYHRDLRNLKRLRTVADTISTIFKHASL